MYIYLANLIGVGNMSDFNFVIRESEKGLDYWKSRKLVAEAIENEVFQADLLLVPKEGYGDYKGPLFPQGTEKIFLFLKKYVPQDISVDICAEDDSFRELALYHDDIILPLLLIDKVMLPIALALLVDYIKTRIAKNKENKSRMKLKIFVKDSERIMEVEYEGPIDIFKEEIVEKLTSSENILNESLNIDKKENDEK